MFIGLGKTDRFSSVTYVCFLPSRLIFTGLFPFSYLSVMNLVIYKKLRMNQKSRVRSKSTLTKSAGNLATILVLIGRGNSFLTDTEIVP